VAAATVPVGVVVLNYDGLGDTLRCLDSLDAADPAPVRIVVVDNGSADGSPEALARRCAGNAAVEFLRLDRNLGYAGGMNRGIERALAHGVDVVLLLNNDTTVRPGVLGPIAAALAAPPGAAPAIATPRILCADERTIWCVGERVFYPLLLTRRGRGRPDGPQFDVPRRINCVTGCAMAVRREVFAKIGFLDEAFFAYVEEIDFCKRARDAGFGFVSVPASIVVHREAGVLGESSPAQVHLKARNRAWFHRKHVPAPLWPVAAVWHALVMCTWALRGVLSGTPGVGGAVVRGTLDALRGRMGPPAWVRP